MVCRKETTKDTNIGIYFIVETKINKEWSNLTNVEKTKIKCGKLHFQAVSDTTKFDWVKSYDDFLDKFKVTDSNKETL